MPGRTGLLILKGIWQRFRAERAGGVSPLLALMLIPMIGAMAIATETTTWYITSRAAQNAADSAVLAAARNGCSMSSTCATATYSDEATAVAGKYGFISGSNNVTITTVNAVNCPNLTPAESDCYKVTIVKKVPIYLARLVGYSGDDVVGSTRVKTVTATAIARPKAFLGYCLVAGAGGIDGNGAPNADLGGCDSFSQGGASCSGHDLNIGTSTTVSTSNNCGKKQVTGATAPSNLDPFAALATNANIPSTTSCPSNTLNSTDLSAYSASTPMVCSGNVTLGTGFTTTKPSTAIKTASGGSVIIIRNGNLALNGKYLYAQGLTVIFSGTAGNNSPGFITGNGTFDASAPSSGTWSGVAMYQDPRMTKNSTQTYTGSNPTFDVTSLMYMPYTSLTVKGAINKASGGYACIGLYVYKLQLSGTGSLFANPTSQCRQAGLSMPGGPSTLQRQALIQ